MIGIYKITSPSKKIYIGQSRDIKKRFNHYRLLDCKMQPILYNSFKKHGFEKHKFEVLELCDIAELNEKERYYQDLYSVLNGKGLNCILTESNSRVRVYSEHTRAIMGLRQKGIKRSDEFKAKCVLRQTGKKLSEETRAKIGLANKGSLNCNFGKFKEKHHMFGNTGEKHHNFGKKWICNKNHPSKKVIDTDTGIIYNSTKELSIILNKHHSVVGKYVLGQIKSITNFKYYEESI